MKAEANIAAWKVVSSIGNGGGISRAAIEAGIDIPACSRLVQGLEQETGIALVDRSSRPARLTEAGEKILPFAKALIESWDALREKLREAASEPAVLSLGLPANLPRTSSIRTIREYKETDPGLSVSITIDASHVDVQEGRVGAALIPYTPEDRAGLVVWPAGRMTNVPLASPEYIAKRGFPRSPEDLKEHDVIIRHVENYPDRERLQKGNVTVPLRFRRAVFKGDVISGLALALSGEGVALDLAYSIARPYIDSGRLVPVLSGWHREEWEISIVISKALAKNARIVRFMKVFVEEETKALGKRAGEVREALGKISARKTGKP